MLFYFNFGANFRFHIPRSVEDSTICLVACANMKVANSVSKPYFLIALRLSALLPNKPNLKRLINIMDGFHVYINDF